MHQSCQVNMLLIYSNKIFLGSIVSEATVKFSDVSEARLRAPIRLAAYETRLNRQETSKKEGVKLSDSLIAIFTAADTPKAD